MHGISNTFDINSQNYNPSLNTINSSIIITPYEKVLKILDSVKKYILSTSKLQTKLIKNLDWVIKIITSHSLYSYELKEKDLISKLAKQNANFKNFVDFVSKYNEQVIEMNKRNIKLGEKTIEVANELLQKPSIKLKKDLKHIKINYSHIAVTPNKYLSTKNKIKKKDEKMESQTPFNISTIKLLKNGNKNLTRVSTNVNYKIKSKNTKFNFSNLVGNDTDQEKILAKKSEIIKEPKIYFIDIDKYNTEINLKKNKKSANKNMLYDDKLNTANNIKEMKYIEKLNKSGYNLSINNLDLLLSNEPNFSPKLILRKEFNIFDLEKKVGQKNVLPIMGRIFLDSFGLINDKIMPIDKLDSFLISITNQYFATTLYHNSLHGSDITHTICLFFNNSNAEEVCHTKAIDLLSIIVSGLGHDIGHPGLTNNFQVNSLSDLAITYNDNSCLENYHLAKLFKTLRKEDTNIFEKLTTQDFKKIRKKMVSEILATDMAIHGKVINNIRSKIPEYLLEDNNNSEAHKKFELISDINNEETTEEEKQALLDYFIHAADLGHNTKKFSISLKWVELLSKEFWLQGDKEKKMNLSVSFLCDRDNTDVPKSQVGFIGGFVLPTYHFLISMFPSLSYTTDNAKNNMKEWQKLIEQKRKTGWTPAKKKKNEEENKNKKEGNVKKKKETIFVDIEID